MGELRRMRSTKKPAYTFRRICLVGAFVHGLRGSRAELIIIVRVEVTGDLCVCGLAEFYGLRDDVHKISVDYRFLERSWVRGVTTGTDDFLWCEAMGDLLVYLPFRCFCGLYCLPALRGLALLP